MHPRAVRPPGADARDDDERNGRIVPDTESGRFSWHVRAIACFEPRYRQMVDDSLETGRMIGITHTRKQIHAGRRHESVQEALASNQATYQPHEVFSAGPCEVIERTEDGRIHAIIHAEKRLRLGQELQTLPYRIVEAEEVYDEQECEDESRDIQRAVNDRLLELIGDKDERLLLRIESEEWKHQAPAAYSFRVFQYLRFEPELMQSILESTRASERLHAIDQVLQSVS
jgi:Lon protease-like protein